MKFAVEIEIKEDETRAALVKRVQREVTEIVDSYQFLQETKRCIRDAAESILVIMAEEAVRDSARIKEEIRSELTATIRRKLQAAIKAEEKRGERNP